MYTYFFKSLLTGCKHLICSGQKQSDIVEDSGSKEEKENLDPAMQADMDEFLDECFNEGSLVRILP